MVTEKTLNEIKDRLVKVYDPIKIYLFGSYAWGTPTEDSDVDLLIIIEHSDEKRHRRGIPGLEALWGMGISKDLLVFTQEEFQRNVADADTLCHKVNKLGKILYARA